MTTYVIQTRDSSGKWIDYSQDYPADARRVALNRCSSLIAGTEQGQWPDEYRLISRTVTETVVLCSEN